jgi:hypothetical protein
LSPRSPASGFYFRPRDDTIWIARDLGYRSGAAPASPSSTSCQWSAAAALMRGIKLDPSHGGQAEFVAGIVAIFGIVERRAEDDCSRAKTGHPHSARCACLAPIPAVPPYLIGGTVFAD